MPPKTLPIAITILRLNDKFLFLKRQNPPYENLWSLVGGKIDVGEHVPIAASREVIEETGAPKVYDYSLKGVVSERLVMDTGPLTAHFIIFVGEARIDSFEAHHREGELKLFSRDEIELNKGEFLPSDLEMFRRFSTIPSDRLEYHEAELAYIDGKYMLVYYREAGL